MDAEGRAHYGPALGAFEYVPSDVADRLLGPIPEALELADAKRDAVILAREIGRLQSGRPVDAGWAFECLRLIAEEYEGIVHWRVDAEDNAPMVRRIVEAAKAEVRKLKIAANEEECARSGAPF